MNILVLLLPGLGDALVASPAIRELKHQHPHAAFHAMSMLPAVKEYAGALGVFDAVHHIPMLSMQPANALRSLLALRRFRFTHVFVPYPAGRWQYHVVSLIVGGKRIAHRYPSRASALLQNVPGSRLYDLTGGHRIDENLNLLQAFKVDGSRAQRSYWMPESWRNPSAARRGIALHVGSMAYKGNEVRRWPLERFEQLVAELPSREPVYIVSGPNERDEAKRIVERRPSTQILEGSLDYVASRLSACRLVIANDSGIAHIAAGLNVPTIVLFGMTKPERALPPGAIAVRPSACPPCFDEFEPAFTCVRNLNFQCIREDLAVSDVIAAVRGVLQSVAS